MKSIERIQQNGEVFTPVDLVDEILDTLPPEVWQPGKTFLDPAAGDGNFLVRILDKKLERYTGDSQSLRFETAFCALDAVYGVELMEDNVERCQMRLLLRVKTYLGKELYNRYQHEFVDIVIHNIVCSDAFKWDFDKWE